MRMKRLIAERLNVEVAPKQFRQRYSYEEGSVVVCYCKDGTNQAIPGVLRWFPRLSNRGVSDILSAPRK